MPARNIFWCICQTAVLSPADGENTRKKFLQYRKNTYMISRNDMKLMREFL